MPFYGNGLFLRHLAFQKKTCARDDDSSTLSKTARARELTLEQLLTIKNRTFLEIFQP